MEIFDTEKVPPRSRVEFWRNAVCETFVEVECGSAAPARFHGSMSTANLGDIQFSDVQSSPHFVSRTRQTIARSDQDCFLLSLQTNGFGIVQQDGRTARLRPGDFALYDTVRPYDLRFDDVSSQIVLRIPRRVVSARLPDPERCTALTIPGDSPSGKLTSVFIRQLHEFIDQLHPDSMARLHACVVDLMATSLAEHAGVPLHGSEWKTSLRRRIFAYVDTHITDPRLSCATVATAHKISERYLRKLFEGSTSLSGWIWTRRLELAKRDLADPMLSHVGITAIGYDSGFKDSAHFSRAFKARYGMTPSEFRSQAALGV